MSTIKLFIFSVLTISATISIIVLLFYQNVRITTLSDELSVINQRTYTTQNTLDSLYKFVTIKPVKRKK